MFLIFTNKSKAGFGNRKWNYPNRKWNYFSYFLSSNQKASFTKSSFVNKKWNYQNRKWSDLSNFLSSNQKTSFTKCFLLLLTTLKLFLKNGNRNIQTGYGIIICDKKRHNLQHSVPNSDSD